MKRRLNKMVYGVPRASPRESLIPQLKAEDEMNKKSDEALEILKALDEDNMRDANYEPDEDELLIFEGDDPDPIGISSMTAIDVDFEDTESLIDILTGKPLDPSEHAETQVVGSKKTLEDLPEIIKSLPDVDINNDGITENMIAHNFPPKTKTYRYDALDPDGKTMSGVGEAVNEYVLSIELKKLGLYPLKIYPYGGENDINQTFRPDDLHAKIPEGMQLIGTTYILLKKMQAKGAVSFQTDDEKSIYRALEQLALISSENDFELIRVDRDSTYRVDDSEEIGSGRYILVDPSTIAIDQDLL